MKKERRAGTLTRINRSLESYLAGLGFPESTIATALPWANRLEADAQRWMQRGGFGQRGRISKADAHRILRYELAALSAGGGA